MHADHFQQEVVPQSGITPTNEVRLQKVEGRSRGPLIALLNRIRKMDADHFQQEVVPQSGITRTNEVRFQKVEVRFQM
jgi:hypothetical protein